MRSLEDAARRLVELHEHDHAMSVHALETGAQRLRARRRSLQLRTGGVFVVVAALVAGTTYFARSTGKTTVQVNATAPSTGGVIGPVRTNVQLQAHLGTGVPKGWQPVDFGNARLWVPSNATVLPNGCGGATADAAIVLAPNATSCDNHGWIRMSAYHRPQHLPPKPIRVVHGYAIYLGPDSLISIAYEVPSLGVTITVHDVPSLTDIIRTLAPSSTAVMLRADAVLPTTGWRTVNYGNVQVQVPPSWMLRGLAGATAPCVSQPETLYVGTPSIVPSCPASIAARTGLVDSASIRPSSDDPQVRRTPLHLGSLTLSRLAVDGMTVRVPGTSTDVTVEGGRDGRVAATILHSIHVTNQQAFTADGCDAHVTDPPHNSRPGLDRQVVPDHPTTVLLCRYHGSQVRDATAGALAAAGPADAPAAAAAMNALVVMNPERFCPADNAAAIVFRFEYPSGPPVDVVLHTSGCRTVDNGVASRRIAANDLIAAAEQVVGHDCEFDPANRLVAC